jgi:hypothetical protein
MDWSIVLQAVTVVATVGAVIVALWLGIRGIKQSSQARYDDARPILIMTSDPQSIETPLDWFTPHRIAKVRNVGKGIALHVRSVIYGPESVVGQSPSDKSISDVHWYYWKSDVIRPDEEKGLDHHQEDPGAGVNRFETKNKHIQQYSFNAQGQGPTHLCRISITYHDIFHRKHASIFDFVPNTGWQEIDCLEEIPHDLYDLEMK